MGLKQLAGRRPAKQETKNVTFEYFAPTAKRVCLAGTFNDWNVEVCPLRKDRNGNWTTTISLVPGRYEYLFFVDGGWQCDPRPKECAPNPFGSWNSVIVVD